MVWRIVERSRKSPPTVSAPSSANRPDRQSTWSTDTPRVTVFSKVPDRWRTRLACCAGHQNEWLIHAFSPCSSIAVYARLSLDLHGACGLLRRHTMLTILRSPPYWWLRSAVLVSVYSAQEVTRFPGGVEVTTRTRKAK